MGSASKGEKGSRGWKEESWWTSAARGTIRKGSRVFIRENQKGEIRRSREDAYQGRRAGSSDLELLPPPRSGGIVLPACLQGESFACESVRASRVVIEEGCEICSADPGRPPLFPPLLPGLVQLS